MPHYKLSVIKNSLVAHTLYQYNTNKAIRDGKYLARHMPVLGNVHPIKIENVTSFLCSLELLYY